MTRAAVVFAVLLVLAAVGAALDVGAHRLRHRYACAPPGRRTVRAWGRIRRERSARVITAADIPLAGDDGDGWDRLRDATYAEHQPGGSHTDLATCNAIWQLNPSRREDTP